MKPVLLDVQYRMHPVLAAFSSARFYEGRVRSGVSGADKKPPAGPCHGRAGVRAYRTGP